MRISSLACLFFAAALGTAVAQPPPPKTTTLPLPASALELVTDGARFEAWSLVVAEEVERLLGEPTAIDDPEVLRMVLSTRVHLAHDRADNATALSTAAWIRSLQTESSARAFAGLTTLASVEARRRHPGKSPDNPDYRATFAEALARRLAALPVTPAIATMLRGQREKIAGLSAESLLAEARGIRASDNCDLATADQIVRIRHRLKSILPLQAETLAAFDHAISVRSPR